MIARTATKMAMAKAMPVSHHAFPVAATMTPATMTPTEPTVSQSLRMLRASAVVTGRRQGRLVFYRLADAHVRMLLDLTREHIAHDQAAGIASAQAIR